MHHPIDRIAHTTAFVTPVVEHWLEREIAQWVHPKKDRSNDPSHHEQTLLPRSYMTAWCDKACWIPKICNSPGCSSFVNGTVWIIKCHVRIRNSHKISLIFQCWHWQNGNIHCYRYHPESDQVTR